MSDKDNPFGTDNNGRTVFRPNPVSRRAKPLSPTTGTPSAESQPTPTPNPSPFQPYTPATAPAYPKPLPDERRARTAEEDWIENNPSARGPAPPMAEHRRPEDLRFDELAAPNDNPIMRAAGPLLLLLGRLRVAMLRASLASLMEQVALAINFFDENIRSAGVTSDQARTAKYLICATADDIVQNIPNEDRNQWLRYSMLSRFFGERTGGVRFFEELDRLKIEPSVNYSVLELQHACLALGFQGVHRTSAGGAAQLQMIQRNLYETLRRVRGKVTDDLSPKWRGQALAARGSRFIVPVWIVASLAALALFGAFIGLRLLLAETAEAAATTTVQLIPNTPVTVQRRLPSPRVEPSARQLTQLQRIRDALGPGVQGCPISADLLGTWVVIRVCSLLMFESGQAAVLPAFIPIAQRIAQIVERESGPVHIVGHTDNQPLNALNHFKNNQQLSVERAKAVVDLLGKTVSQPSRLIAEGRGPDEPIGDNRTVDGRAKNRRVEFLVARSD
jgi:type VI secretion system protein ImpK